MLSMRLYKPATSNKCTHCLLPRCRLTYTHQRRNIGSTQINYKYKVAMPCWHCSSDVAHAFPMLFPVASYTSMYRLCVIYAPAPMLLLLCGISYAAASSMYHLCTIAASPRHHLSIFCASCMHHLCIVHSISASGMHHPCTIYASRHHLCITYVSSMSHTCTMHHLWII